MSSLNWLRLRNPHLNRWVQLMVNSILICKSRRNCFRLLTKQLGHYVRYDWSKTWGLLCSKLIEKCCYLQLIKKPKPCITLWWNTMGIWEHEGIVENTSCRPCTFLECSQNDVRSILSHCNTWLRLRHLLYDIEVMWQKNNKTRFLNPDKT